MKDIGYTSDEMKLFLTELAKNFGVIITAQDIQDAANVGSKLGITGPCIVFGADNLQAFAKELMQIQRDATAQYLLDQGWFGNDGNVLEAIRKGDSDETNT